MTDQPPPPTNNVADAAALIAAVATLVSGSTATIMARLDENSRAATARWQLHDAELERNRVAIAAKFAKIEGCLLTVEKSLDAHLDGHHDEDLVMQARIRPLRTGSAWIVANWKTVGLVLAMLAGWFLLGLESIQHMIVP